MNIWKQERLVRIADGMAKCHFGVAYLTDALLGIYPRDLVILAARTGFGKTELASIIAEENATLAKETVFFALEAEPTEVQSRLKYRYIAKRFFENRTCFAADLHLSYRDWVDGKLDKDFETLEFEADEHVAKELASLNVITPNIAQLTRQDFRLVWDSMDKESVCLVILDHMHYLAESGGECEYDSIKNHTRSLRELVSRDVIPVVAFSHLRKRDKGAGSVCPQLEDLHSASEISKQANVVISFSRISMAVIDGEKQRFETPVTAMQILKTRKGEGDGYVATMKFDPWKKRYTDHYRLYRTNDWGDELYSIPQTELPYWANHALQEKI